MSDYTVLTAQLQAIMEDVNQNWNTDYQLSQDEKHNFDIVINTLLYIVRNINVLKHHDQLWDEYPDNNLAGGRKYAPIHLEEYKNDSREPVLIGSLPQLFVTCFNRVKEAQKVQLFCEKLTGFCIDARTRLAFDFALDLTATKRFSELMEECSKALPDEHTYFEFFVTLLKNHWGHVFKEDLGKNGICKFKGSLNSDLFENINHFMTEILLLNPADDVLKIYNTLQDHEKTIYLNFILAMPNFQEWLKDLKMTLPSKSLDDFLLKLSKLINWEKTLSNPPEQKLDINQAEKIITIFETLTPHAFHKNWPMLSSPLNKGHEIDQEAFNHLDERALRSIEKLISDPELDYVASHYPSKDYIISTQLALRSNNPDLAIKLLAYTKSKFLPKDITSTMQLAIKMGQTEFIQKFVGINKESFSPLYWEQMLFQALEHSNKDLTHLFCHLYLQDDEQDDENAHDFNVEILKYLFTRQAFITGKNSKIAAIFLSKISDIELEKFLNTIIASNDGDGLIGDQVFKQKNLMFNKLIIAHTSVKLPHLVAEFDQSIQIEAKSLSSSNKVSSSFESIMHPGHADLEKVFQFIQNAAANNQPFDGAFAMTNRLSVTALSWLAMHKGLIFDIMIQKANNKDIDDALVIKSKYGTTALSVAAEKLNSNYFCALINKCSSNAIDAALVVIDDTQNTSLALAAEKQESDAFQTLINKASSDAINMALIVSNKISNNPLILAAGTQDSAAFQLLVNKCSSDAIDFALVVTNKDRITALNIAAEMQESDAFQTLINKASPNAIDTALVVVNNRGNSPLISAARKQNSVAFQALVNKCSSNAIDNVLVIKNHYAFLEIAFFQDSIAFQSVINKASSNAINTALVLIDIITKVTTLTWAAQKHDFTTFEALINKASSEAILTCLKNNAPSLDDLKTLSAKRNIPLLGKILLKLINENQMIDLSKYKTDLKDYIFNLPRGDARNKLLHDCLKSDTSLGKFFSKRRFFTESKTLIAIRAKIGEEEKQDNQHRP